MRDSTPRNHSSPHAVPASPYRWADSPRSVSISILTLATIRLFVPSSLLLLALTGVADAKPATDWATRKREKKEAVASKVEFEENPRSYSLPLGFGYAVPPVLFGSSILVWGTGGSPPAPLLYLSLASLLVVPPSIHIIHGNGHGAAKAIFGSLGSTLSLGFIGGTITRATSDCADANDDNFCEGFSFLGGALIGGVIGYVSWAIVDVAFLARTPIEATAQQTARLQLAPTVAPIVTRTAASHTPTLHGVSFGVMGQF